MLLDQSRQPIERQLPIVDRELKLGGHRVAFDTAVTGTSEHVGPPLQAHLAWQRLAHHLPYPRNLDIEGVDRQ